MTEYKTKLEEFTLDELKTIVEEAPDGWEDYRGEDECDFAMYRVENRTARFLVHTESHEIWEDIAPDCREESFHSKDAIKERIKLLEFVETDTPSKYNKVLLEISEFVNEVKFVDGKIYLDIDKEDIEGVIKLLEEMRDGW